MKIMCTELSQIDKRCIHVGFFFLFDIFFERFWNNIHQVAQDQKIGKPNNFSFGNTISMGIDVMFCFVFVCF
jgi:hypothetical protein